MASARQRTSIVCVTIDDGAATFDAGRLFGVLDVNRNVDADRRTLAKPHEIHMQGKVANGIELEVARNNAMRHPVDLDIVNSGQKVPCIDRALKSL